MRIVNVSGETLSKEQLAFLQRRFPSANVVDAEFNTGDWVGVAPTAQDDMDVYIIRLDQLSLAMKASDWQGDFNARLLIWEDCDLGCRATIYNISNNFTSYLHGFWDRSFLPHPNVAGVEGDWSTQLSISCIA